MSVQITLSVPDTLYEQATEAALARRRPVEALLADILVGVHPPLARPAPSDPLQQEKEAWARLRPQLVAQYLGEVVALHTGQVVEHDLYEMALLTRIEARYPDEIVLMRRVTTQPLPPLRFRAPRFVREPLASPLSTTPPLREGGRAGAGTPDAESGHAPRPTKGCPMTPLAPLLTAMVAAYRGPAAHLSAISERPGEAGLSGALVRVFDVTLRDASGEQALPLVVKNASLMERRVYAHLQGQGVPNVPFTYVADLLSDAPQPLMQPYLADGAPLTLPPNAAEALATLHLANLAPHPIPSWLPRADVATLTQMVDEHWRTPWQRTLAGEEVVDSYGVPWSPCVEAETFATRFAATLRRSRRQPHAS